MFFSDFYTHIDVYRYSTFDLDCIFYYRVYIYICTIHVLLMFLIHLFLFSQITPKFTSSVFFGTHILPDVSLRVLQLQSHLSKLTASG